MNINELEKTLFELSESEKIHQTHDGLPERYQRIDKVMFDNREIYQFKFDRLFKDSNFCINKESRFTFIPEHIHTVIELLYVYSGQCTQVIDGKVVKMKQGDLCLLDTNVPHSIQYIEEGDILISIEMRKEYLSMGFLSRLGEKGIINNFLINALSSDTTHDQYLLFTTTNHSPVHHIIQNILCEYYDQQFCSDKIVDSYIVILFCELLRLYKDKQFLDHTDDAHPIIDILDYLENNYLTTNLKETAQHFGFHPNYLSSYIKKTTGKNFKELIILQRMVQACFFLSNTDMPIYEIANQVGYDNLGFFYTKFESIYKMTPATYRQIKNEMNI